MQQLQHKAVVLLPVFKALGRQRTTSVFTSSCRLVLQNNSIRHSSTGASNDRNSQHGIESTSDASVNLNSATSAQSVSTGSLPSATESQRLQASKKLSKLMDGLLSRASIAGQHINEYTGTDYTAIDALRKDISKQEEVVKNCATGCNAARAQQQDAHNNQSNASREIVGLLERKSSWSPVDLERYMALVRSDHVNEQAVQAAKDNLKAMEQKLDEARAMLERLERKRYHEEQIWSDTIRRNSTWVTFGLMGVNIILLLAQITIFEPHRRKKIAADVQEMLDKRERNSTAAIDEDALASLVSRVLNKTQPATSPEVRSDIDLVNELLSRDIAPGTSGESSGAAIPPPQPRLMRISAEPWWSAASAADRLRMTRDIISDQFSERLVQLRKMDVTTVACIGAAVGAAISSGLIVGLSRPT